MSVEWILNLPRGHEHDADNGALRQDVEVVDLSRVYRVDVNVLLRTVFADKIASLSLRFVNLSKTDVNCLEQHAQEFRELRILDLGGNKQLGGEDGVKITSIVKKCMHLYWVAMDGTQIPRKTSTSIMHSCLLKFLKTTSFTEEIVWLTSVYNSFTTVFKATLKGQLEKYSFPDTSALPAEHWELFKARWNTCIAAKTRRSYASVSGVKEAIHPRPFTLNEFIEYCLPSVLPESPSEPSFTLLQVTTFCKNSPFCMAVDAMECGLAPLPNGVKPDMFRKGFTTDWHGVAMLRMERF
eukprot:TRINITY_DN8418_c0_g1_i2.p1 TRINITY_DN8418_c0_g1~~TRINITY_DN8418_c0_g1_i2.p1  ORF type:complete len:296 (+),score=34.81 TRINITY_DN8418_c0_g1_i2:158-1045(+)